MSSRFLTVNGHQLYIDERGLLGAPAVPSLAQPVVVLLHHGLGSTHAWRSQFPALTRAGYRTLAYDRWGYGRSAPRSQLSMPYFEEDQADLLTILDQMQIWQAALVGHSDGGTIALYFAARHPERVTCLVILAAHAYVDEYVTAGMPYVLQQYREDASFRSKLQRRHGGQTETMFMAWYNGWYKEANRDWDMRPDLGRIRCPTLVMQGDEDEHAPPQHVVDIASAIPGAELHLVPGAGHMLQRERAREVNRRLLGFLGQVVRQELTDVQ